MLLWRRALVWVPAFLLVVVSTACAGAEDPAECFQPGVTIAVPAGGVTVAGIGRSVSLPEGRWMITSARNWGTQRRVTIAVAYPTGDTTGTEEVEVVRRSLSEAGIPCPAPVSAGNNAPSASQSPR